MVEQQQPIEQHQSGANLPRQPRPLSNSEVKNLLEMHLSSRANQQPSATNNFDIPGNETGNELRQQTIDYIELFNDFELGQIISDIRG